MGKRNSKTVFSLENWTKKIIFSVFFVSSAITAQPLNNWLEFDGKNDYVNLGKSSYLKPKSAVTIELWAYKVDWSISTSESFISNTEKSGYSLELESGYLKGYVRLRFEYQIPSVNIKTLSDGWHHFALTCDGRYTKLYVDGKLKDVINKGRNEQLSYSSRVSTLLGAEASLNSEPDDNYLKGALDEVRIWEIVRTEQEINDNMYCEIDNTTNGLMGYWKLNETTGTEALNEVRPQNGDLTNYSPTLWKQSYSDHIALSGGDGSKASWGDYNNDGFIDVLLYTGSKTQLYRNNGDGSFSKVTTISYHSNGTASWGDYNNDGLLDIAVSGQNSSHEKSTRIFKNNGDETFSNQPEISLEGSSFGDIEWGDYDNDNDLDLFIIGAGSGFKLYKNNGDGDFTDSGISLSTISSSSDISLADYDSDGDLDVLLLGYSEVSKTSVSELYKNNGDGTFTASNVVLPDVQNGSTAWGDFNNDGMIDLIITGFSNSQNSKITKVYKNLGLTGSEWTFEEMSGINIPPLDLSSPSWGDYNNDGNLDILVAGRESNSNSTTKVYQNNGDETFTPVILNLANVSDGSVAWGDYNNDDKLDILLTGSSKTHIYKNNRYNFSYTSDNSNPSVPTNLNETISGNSVVFSWNSSSDSETPSAGLTYNLRIGSTPGGSDILIPMSNLSKGNLKTPIIGNINHNTSWIIKNLIPGQPYYWSVQSIDNGFVASAFSSERMMKITGVYEKKAGNSLEFDGLDNVVNCGNNSSLDTKNSITVEAWLYYQGGVDYPRIIDKFPAPSIYIKEDKNILGWWGNINGGAKEISFENSVVSRNQWTHIAVTYDGSKLKSYINGELRDTKSYSGPLSITTNDLTIGNNIGKSRGYKGKIEELRLWNIARSESEIRENMHKTLSESETGLLAYWQMNEEEGQKAREVASANIGTLQNMTENSWVKSSTPLGDGISNSQIEVNGTVEFSNTDASMNFSEQDGAGITVTKISNSPNLIPELETFDNKYWVINRFGTGTFNTNITFINEELEQADQDNHDRIKLYRRDNTSEGDWEFVTTANSVNAFNKSATFNNITQFGQFILCKESNSQDNFAGNILQFDGVDDIVNCGSNSSFDTPSEFTIEAWVYYTGGGTYPRIVDKYPAYSILINHKTNKIGWTGICLTSANNDEVKYDATFSNSEIQLNEWTHIAVVWDNKSTTYGVKNEFLLYINGEYRSTYKVYNELQITTNDLHIGNREAVDRAFAGKIDEVRLWNGVRNKTEIRENMHRIITESEENLLGYWQMNSSSGSSTAIDCANGNDGTLYNMDVSNCWIQSEVPTGNGSSNSSLSFTNGNINLGKVSITTTDDFDNSVDLLCTGIENSPNTISGTSGNVLDRYFVVAAFGNPGTFSTNLTFTLPDGKISSEDQTTPSNLKLYRRASTSDGDWSFVASGSSATQNTVTFENITSFSQFTIGSETSPLPVELTSFKAELSENNIILNWETATEVNNYGFEIERQITGTNTQISKTDWEVIGFVEGHGNSNSIKKYSFTDTPNNGNINFSYRLKQIDTDGKFEYSKTLEIKLLLPEKFVLKQNYPNPFNPSTEICYELPENGLVNLKIYNILGEEVITLINEEKEAGIYKTKFNAHRLASGIYFYTLQVRNFIKTKKMILTK